MCAMDIKGENEAANNQSAICWLFAAHWQFLPIASSGRKATTTPLRAEIKEKEAHFAFYPATHHKLMRSTNGILRHSNFVTLVVPWQYPFTSLN